MKKTSNGIPYSHSNPNTVTLFPSKESHKLSDAVLAKKEMKALGFKIFMTWTRNVKPLMAII